MVQNPLRMSYQQAARVLALLCLAAGSMAEASDRPSSDLDQYDALIRPQDRAHWSFQPVVRRDVPLAGDDWIRTPIDSFILHRLEANGWRPAPPATPEALLRRFFLDVTGIPPTIDEQDQFLKQLAELGLDAAIDRLVDDLLSRPAYGERWARHWLDVVRYAETNGYERDAAKPHVWRYRDYVIGSWNADKPFDRFILEQVAGDELPDSDAESLIATGMHRLGHWDDEPADPKEDRFDQLDDIVSTTTQAFLGLSIGCARCHNHKFEPLTMHDYYRMVAIFDPLERPRNGRTELDLPAGTREELARQSSRDAAIASVQSAVAELRKRAYDEYVESGRSRLGSDVVIAFWTDSAKRSAEQKQLVERHSKQLADEATAAISQPAQAQIDRLERRIEELRAAGPELIRGYFMRELPSAVPVTHLLIRGKAARPGPQVSPGLPAVLAEKQPPFIPPDSLTSRRRLSLAQWIADPGNPLTARVIVNRVWLHHFGAGLVNTPNDFGRAGSPPSHPELLDWLAHWFVHDAGWSVKKLHRLILTSNAYRMGKGWSETEGAADPENRLLWRQNYRRLEVEAIRDSVLGVSGQLNRKMYGPSMLPPVPRAALEANSDPDKIWKASGEHEAARRTIYAFIKRAMVVPMLEVLDLCDTTRSAAQRQVTTIAPQALTLFNGDFVNESARAFAERIVAEAGSDPARQIDHAYRLALCRRPTEAETAAMLRFLGSESLQGEAGSNDLAAARLRALQQVCRVIFNLNEFVYTD